MKKKFRVFKTSLGWSDAIFYFNEETKFNDIKKHPETHMLTQEDFIGVYEFDKKYVNMFNNGKIGEQYYFYQFCYQKDNLTPEEMKWKRIPEVPEWILNNKQVEVKEYKNIEVKDDESNAGDFQSLFD